MLENIIKEVMAKGEIEFGESTKEYDLVTKIKNRTLLLDKSIYLKYGYDSNKQRFVRVFLKADEKNTSKTLPKTKKVKKPKGVVSHVYEPSLPDFAEVQLYLEGGIRNFWFQGPTGSGKTSLAKYIADGNIPNTKLLENIYNDNAMQVVNKKRKYIIERLNCSPCMERADLIGEVELSADPLNPNQTITRWKKGKVEMAMTHGLDKSGNVIPDSDPGMLIIDEIASAPPQVAQVLQSFMEVEENGVRRLTIEADGGREVKSHPGLVVVFTSNTNGRGITDNQSALYTQQTDALDISFLDRTPAQFFIDYNTVAEKHILMRFLGNDKLASLVIRFRDSIRKFIDEGNCSTPFSTRNILAMCKLANSLSIGMKQQKAVLLALHRVFFQRLQPEEKTIYNEQIFNIFGEHVDKMVIDMRSETE